MGKSPAEAALDALGRASTWEGALQLYYAAVPGSGRADAEAAFQLAAAQGWLLSALPDLRLLIEAWQTVTRVQDDAQRAREEAEKHRLPDGSHTAMDRNLIGTAFAKANDSATRAESIGLSGLATIARLLDRWRRACVAFETEYSPQGREPPGYESWRRAAKKLLRIQITEGDLAMALRLVPMVRSPEALTDQHLDPVIQARAQVEDLERQRRHAAAMGDTAALVQLQPVIDKAADRYATARLGSDTSNMTDEERDAEIERMNAERAGR